MEQANEFQHFFYSKMAHFTFNTVLGRNLQFGNDSLVKKLCVCSKLWFFYATYCCRP